MLHLHRVADEWLPLLLSVLISTLATLIVTALVMKLFMLGNKTNTGESRHDAANSTKSGSIFQPRRYWG